MEEKTDLELIRESQNGDKAAFGELAGRYQSAALAMARRYLSNHYQARRLVQREEIAQEIAQEAMLRVYLSIRQLRDPARFKSWLYGIMLNVSRGFLRDQKTVYYSLESLAGGIQLGLEAVRNLELSPEQMAEEAELSRMVRDAIESLPAADRNVIWSFYYDQLSAREIAGLLGFSAGAVKVRLHRARRRLKEILLPVYTDLITEKSGRKKLLKVKILDVAKSVQRVTEGHEFTMYILWLAEESSRRAMPIWVGAFEGQTIAMEIEKAVTPRPLTFQFMSNLLKALGAALKEVRIAALKDGAFYATAKIECGGVMHEIDARPSDAIALALLMECPLYVAEEVFEQAAVSLPAGVEITDSPAGTAQIMADLKKLHTFDRPMIISPEELKKANQVLIDRLLG